MNHRWMAGVGVTLLVSAAFAAQFEGSRRQGTTAGSRFVNQLEPMPAITFADRTGTSYIPARAVAQLFNHHVDFNREDKTVTIGKDTMAVDKMLFNGRTLVPVRTLEKLGATIDMETDPGKVLVSTSEGAFEIQVGKKLIDVDQATQKLVGYQGDVVVVETKVSTGAAGHRTPNGKFTTGPYKARMHYSKLYNNAPMPYSIQVNGNVFFHGFGSVPRYPASHGCIRIPLTKGNPAKFLYNWVDKGVEVNIHGKWSGSKKRSKR